MIDNIAEDGLSRQQFISEFAIIGVVALISPCVAVFIALFLCFAQKKNENIILLIFFLALYLSAINATKLPEGDQEAYMYEYLSIPAYSIGQTLTGTNLNMSVFVEKHEYGWVILNIVGYYASFGYYSLFVVEFSLIIYLLLFISIYRFYKKINIENQYISIITGILIVGFFPQLFSQTMHLERQCIASSIFIFALVDYINREKPRLWLLLLPAFFHTSQILLILIVLTHYLHYIYNRYNEYSASRFFVSLLVFSVAIGFTSVFATFLITQGPSLYGVERLSHMGNSTEETLDVFFALKLIIPMCGIILLRLIKSKDVLVPYETKFYLVYGCLIIFAMLNPDNTMKYRFFNMSYMYMPFIVPLMFSRSQNLHKVYLLAVSIFFPIFFFTTFHKHPFNFASTSEIILDSLYSLITYR
ncbi:MAG: EpsG family protein [Paludibacteraceae bacterium]|nr:EpsG family protein [Paludibacteraceae bacterium]